MIPFFNVRASFINDLFLCFLSPLNISIKLHKTKVTLFTFISTLVIKTFGAEGFGKKTSAKKVSYIFSKSWSIISVKIRKFVVYYFPRIKAENENKR